ncbi:hypothetical protein [Saccharopolyspora sp. NPDC002578]
MPKDDRAFFADAESADQEFKRVSNEKFQESFVYMGDMTEERMVRFDQYYNTFRGMGLISGGTTPVIERIESEVRTVLVHYELENAGPIGDIRRMLDGWSGDSRSASYNFKNHYLRRLSDSMARQYSAALAMQCVMEAHEAVIDQARQRYLDLIDNATRAIDESVELARRSSPASSLTTVISAIATGFTIGAPTGGAHGAVVGAIVGAAAAAIQTIGTHLDSTSSTPVGSEWYSIADDTLIKLDAVLTAVGEETREVEKSLDQVLQDIGKRDFLAPQV